MVSGKAGFLFKLAKFDSDGSDFSKLFPLTSNEAFVDFFNTTATKELEQCAVSSAFTTPPARPKLTPAICKKTPPLSSTEEFVSPPKKRKVNIDEEIATHHLGIP